MSFEIPDELLRQLPPEFTDPAVIGMALKHATKDELRTLHRRLKKLRLVLSVQSAPHSPAIGPPHCAYETLC